MPVIEITTVAGILTEAQREEMVTKIAEVAIAIEGEQSRSITMVAVNEVPAPAIIAGKLITEAAVRARRSGG